jgi:hypothetical protein
VAGSLGSFLPGEVVTSTWTTAPASGSVSLANVTARIIGPDGTITSLSGITGSANVWNIIFTISSTAAPGDWTLRWESNTPSAVLVKELSYSVKVTPFGASA